MIPGLGRSPEKGMAKLLICLSGYYSENYLLPPNETLIDKLVYFTTILNVSCHKLVVCLTAKQNLSLEINLYRSFSSNNACKCCQHKGLKAIMGK